MKFDVLNLMYKKVKTSMSMESHEALRCLISVQFVCDPLIMIMTNVDTIMLS